MALDLTVAAVPFYFASMEAERRALRARYGDGDEATAEPAVYTRDDTLASLAMGVGSLVVPLATGALARHVVPGKGRFPKVLVRSAVAGGVVTTVADAVERRTRRPRLKRWARRVASIGGVATVATGGLAASTTFAHHTAPQRMWRKGRHRDLGTGPRAWLAAVLGWDFIYYWNHRFMHEIRAMWALHVVHHSSERYNLSTALRQPVADVLGIWVPYGLLARAGVRPSLITHARAINLLYQYWIHTETIESLGPGESVLNTPSHHRVHHGSQGQYLDRNHGSILIVWDRLFGTFEPEDERVVYGLTRNIETFNPLRIATHEYADIGRDVAASDNWVDRISFVVRGPGWAYARRAELEAEAGPAGVLTDVEPLGAPVEAGVA